MSVPDLVSESEIRAALGLLETISTSERLVLALAHREAISAVRSYLRYDPMQYERTEYYPRADRSKLNARYVEDVTRDHLRAIQYNTYGNDCIILSALPLRQIVSVQVDTSARFGTATNAFGSGTTWTEGDEFWAEWDQDNLAMSATIFAYGSWPAEPGSVKITARIGFSETELAGMARTSGTAADGQITTAGVDASPIRIAAILTAVKSFHNIWSYRKRNLAGFTPGALASEKLGDYSYTLAARQISGMTTDIPPEAASKLDPFVNYAAIIGA